MFAIFIINQNKIHSIYKLYNPFVKIFLGFNLVICNFRQVGIEVAFCALNQKLRYNPWWPICPQKWQTHICPQVIWISWNRTNCIYRVNHQWSPGSVCITANIANLFIITEMIYNNKNLAKHYWSRSGQEVFQGVASSCSV